MKTNNIASYSDVLVACMRQNPRWILLSEVRSAEAVLAVRNSISSGHNILSTIHSDKASSIPMRLYSLLESSQDIDQFVKGMHRYIQLGIHVKGFYSKKFNRFQREITQVVEFYVDEVTNEAKVNVLYARDLMENEVYNNPTSHLIDYLASQGVMMQEDPFIPKESVLQNAENPTAQVTQNDLQDNTPSNDDVKSVIQEENDNVNQTSQVIQEEVIPVEEQVKTNEVPTQQNIEMIEI